MQEKALKNQGSRFRKVIIERGGELVSCDPIAYNPVIKIYRIMASGVRTADEHPLTRNDIQLFEKYFSKVKYKGTWLLTNWIFIKFYLFDKINPGKERYWILKLKKHKELAPLYNKLEVLDRKLLKVFPWMKWWCWNMVVIARK